MKPGATIDLFNKCPHCEGMTVIIFRKKDVKAIRKAFSLPTHEVGEFLNPRTGHIALRRKGASPKITELLLEISALKNTIAKSEGARAPVQHARQK